MQARTRVNTEQPRPKSVAGADRVIMTLQQFSLRIEVYSIDEMFLSLAELWVAARERRIHIEAVIREAVK